MKIWTFFDTFWSTIVEIFDCGGAGGTREGRREGRRGGRDRGLVAVGGAHLTHCAHIYAGRGGGGTGGGAEGLWRGRRGCGGTEGPVEGLVAVGLVETLLLVSMGGWR